MRIVVGLGEPFRCPVCGARYVLEPEDDGSIVIAVPNWADGDRFCNHLDPEILPTGGDKWEVYFTEPESD
jgi:hypothetical protein